jgi:preprotein translocase subunit SecG
MDTLLTIVHVLVCLFLVGIVLLQHGKGADIGASFGGSSQSLFGTEGPLPLLNKITTAVAVIFMITSVALAYISANSSTGSIMKELSQEQAVETEQKSQEIEKIPMPATEEKQPVETEEQTENTPKQ